MSKYIPSLSTGAQNLRTHGLGASFALRFSLCCTEGMVKMCVDISWMHRRHSCRITILRNYILWSFLVMFGTLILHLTSLRGFYR